MEERIFEICHIPHIYMTFNRITGKAYIGQHSGRLAYSYLGSGTAIKNSIKKYGIGNFDKIILESWETVPSNIDDIEINYIFLYETYKPNGYNISLRTGCNIHKYGKTPPNKGKKMSQSTVEKLRLAKLNSDYVATDSHKEKLRQAGLGVKKSEEAIMKRRMTRSRAVLQVHKETGQILNRYTGSSFAAEALNLNANLNTVKRGIRSCCTGRYTEYAGYIWKYEE